MMEEAIELYNAGNWKLSEDKLKALLAMNIVGKRKGYEVDVLFGWNWWKMGRKQDAAEIWERIISMKADVYSITLSSAHAGLSIYYAEKGSRGKALKHAQSAQDLLPKYAMAHENKTLNSCGIVMAKIGELKKAEEILKKVAGINEQLMQLDDPKVAKEAKHQRGKNSYNLATLIHIPQENWNAADDELKEAIVFYRQVGAETDEAAAHHRRSEIYEKNNFLHPALVCERRSLKLWEKHPDDPGRVETAQRNINRIEAKMREQE